MTEMINFKNCLIKQNSYMMFDKLIDCHKKRQKEKNKKLMTIRQDKWSLVT